jgi:signal transduction histidine kinase/CheY-like chemotaxis protein
MRRLELLDLLLECVEAGWIDGDVLHTGLARQRAVVWRAACLAPGKSSLVTWGPVLKLLDHDPGATPAAAFRWLGTRDADEWAALFSRISHLASSFGEVALVLPVLAGNEREKHIVSRAFVSASTGAVVGLLLHRPQLAAGVGSASTVAAPPTNAASSDSDAPTPLPLSARAMAASALLPAVVEREYAKALAQLAALARECSGAGAAWIVATMGHKGPTLESQVGLAAELSNLERAAFARASARLGERIAEPLPADRVCAHSSSALGAWLLANHFLAVPLVGSQGPLGWVLLAFDAAKQLTEAQAASLEVAVQGIALTLDTKRREWEFGQAQAEFSAESRKNDVTLSVLHQLSKALTSIGSHDEAWTELLGQLDRVAALDCAALVARRSAGSVCHVWMRRPLAPDARRSMVETAAALLAVDGAKAASPEVRAAAPRFAGALPIRALRTQLLIPLTCAASPEPLGVLAVAAERINAFDSSQLRLLETLAQQVAFTLERLRLQWAEQRRQLLGVVGELPMGIVVTDGADRVQIANRAAQTLLGAAATTQGAPLRFIGDVELAGLRRGEARDIRHAGEDGVVRSVEITLHRPGESDDLDCNALRVVTARDVTQERERQQRAMQRDRMVLVGQLAHGVAHDFNNFLSVILGNVDLLSMGIRSDSPLYADLTEIRRAGERSAALVRQLTDFSRTDEGAREDVDLERLVLATGRMVRRALREDIALEIELAPALPRILADRGSIERVMMNLVLNARDALPQGGVIRLRTAQAALSPATAELWAADPKAEFVTLTVQDNGIGMDAYVRARLFEPYFTTKPAGRGTGLGLASVYGIVRQHGGAIELTSEPGGGSTFVVYLPALPRTSRAEARETPPRPVRVGNETILLVDDNDDVRTVANRNLVQAGYRVLLAEDAYQALVIASERSAEIRLVITDVLMPGMGGFELVKRLRAVLPNCKYLYVSGYTPPEEWDRTGRSDEQFLQKPFAPWQLSEKIRVLLDGVEPR